MLFHVLHALDQFRSQQTLFDIDDVGIAGLGLPSQFDGAPQGTGEGGGRVGGGRGRLPLGMMNACFITGTSLTAL